MLTLLLNLLSLFGVIFSITLVDDIAFETPHHKSRNRILLASLLIGLASTRMAAWQEASLFWTLLIMLAASGICYLSLYTGMLQDAPELTPRRAAPMQNSGHSQALPSPLRSAPRTRPTPPRSVLPQKTPAPDVIMYQATGD